MKHGRVVAQLSDDVDAIVSGLAAALAHLEEWTGEFPGSASGAPPATASGVVRAGEDESTDDGDVAVLTRFEQMAESGDRAMLHRSNLLGRLRSASTLARKTLAAVDGVMLPVEFESDSRDLAVLRWAVRRLRVDADDVGATALNKLARAVETVRRLVDQWQPPQSGPIDGCRLHRAAGAHAPIDHHNYGLRSLCRKCGDFRRDYQADPTPTILREWSKSRKPDAAMIAEAKSLAKKKRQAKLAKKKRNR